jgi:predicted nucleic acid-binding protein
MIELFEKAAESSSPLFMCIINWGEVYYQVARRFGDIKAQEIEQLIETLPITMIEADKHLPREAARIKAKKRIAYADCFAAALAHLKKAELYTKRHSRNQMERCLTQSSRRPQRVKFLSNRRDADWRERLMPSANFSSLKSFCACGTENFSSNRHLPIGGKGSFSLSSLWTRAKRA